MISLSATRDTLTGVKADVVALFVAQDRKTFAGQIQELERKLKSLSPPLHSGIFSGKEYQTLALHPIELKNRILLLVGIGKKDTLSAERLRRAAAVAAKTARSMNKKSLAIMEPDPDLITSNVLKGNWTYIGTSIAEGAALGLYRFDKYFTDNEKKNSKLKQVVVVGTDRRRAEEIRTGVEYARVLCEATYFARDLENAPGNEVYPDSLAKRAVATGRKYNFKVTVFNEQKIKKLKMGGLLGVSQGSERPPRFVIMEHNGGKRRLPTVVLVGKGVTFDAGGISIKPASGMSEMKMDMSGAAGVIGTMQAAARLKLPVHLVGLVPATENLLGGAAMKPGDILTHFNGKTSEVDNTDAEGRLILADALSYAAKYKPDLVIDLATLTGAVVVALGHYATGMMGNDDEVMEQLKAAGERTYERVWQLPMFDEYEKLVKSDVADVKNVGGRWGGAITAAVFLKKFIGDYKWVHLDIAGTAIMDESLEYIPKGGSGVGVRLLIDFLRNQIAVSRKPKRR